MYVFYPRRSTPPNGDVARGVSRVQRDRLQKLFAVHSIQLEVSRVIFPPVIETLVAVHEAAMRGTSRIRRNISLIY